MLANDKFAPDVLLTVLRLRIPTHSPISDTIIDFLGEIYVNNTDLIVTRPKLMMAAVAHMEVDRSVSTWVAGLNATGGALNPDKCKWTLADYCWHNGSWGYAKQPKLDIEIPLPNGTTAKISEGEVLVAEKAFGIWSSIDGKDNAHVKQNVTDQLEKWIDKMRNGHLPTKLRWIKYRFKLWAGVRYGLASLATSFLVAKGVLKQQNFKLLAFLGVNCNVKRE
jgi:hypothetical protein